MTLPKPNSLRTPTHGAAGHLCDIAIAASQIELAIKESLKPVDELGSAMGSLATLLEQLGHDLVPDGDARPALARMRAEVSACVQALQFHDCMVQHLSHVRDYLALGAGITPCDETWLELRKQLRSRLITQDQRRLFDLLVDPVQAPGNADSRSVSAGPGEGSVELF